MGGLDVHTGMDAPRCAADEPAGSVAVLAALTTASQFCFRGCCGVYNTLFISSLKLKDHA